MEHKVKHWNIYFHLKNINKHKGQKICDFYGLDLAQDKMYMIWITLKELKELKKLKELKEIKELKERNKLKEPKELNELDELDN